MDRSPTHNKSPSPFPGTPGNANSIFFAGDFGSSPKIERRSSSPSNKTSISITVDAADEGTGAKPTTDVRLREAPKGKRPNAAQAQDKTKAAAERKKGPGRMSRRDTHAIPLNDHRAQRKFVAQSFEYDRELIRRQQAMIAIQPMTGLEEIDYKREMLRKKVENRKRAEQLAYRSGASTSLGNFSGSKSQPASRSPSPSRFAEKGSPEYHRKKELADNVSKTSRMTKKVSTGNKSLTPKVTAAKNSKVNKGIPMR